MDKIRMNIVIAVMSCLMFGQSFGLILISDRGDGSIVQPLRAVITESNNEVDRVSAVIAANMKKTITKVGLIAGTAGAIGAGAAHVLMSKESYTRTAVRLLCSVVAVCGFGAAASVQ